MSSLSIRARLTLLYAGSVLLVLAVASFGLRVVLRDGLEREFRRAQLATVALVQNQFAVELEEYPTVDSAASHLVGEVLFPDRRVTLLDPNGQPALPNRHLAEVRLGDQVRILEAPLSPTLAPGWTVRVTFSVTGLDRSTRRLDRGLALGILASAFLAGLTGWWLTGRTLEPVGAMAHAAESISATHPSERLPVSDPSDELGRLGVAFNDLLDRLERALGQQRQFLADAAHELRTPIARVRSQLELAERPGAAPVTPETVAGLHADLERMGMMLDELLQLARADAGERSSQPLRIFLDDVAHQATAGWRSAAERRGVVLEFEVPDHEVPVIADPVLLRRLVDTLMDNAIRYSPSGGRIEVRARLEDGSAVLDVADRGIGIPDDERRRLFERFFRGREARQMAPEGSGLGLPIARWIAERHGGSVELLAREGGGTVARVTLPTNGDQPAQAGDGQALPQRVTMR
ncbi:MAG: ATP-binding protein [Gemmatimonadota bacterium]|nr:ATP-binding protein [Gemmatimonadota bacterium]